MLRFSLLFITFGLLPAVVSFASPSPPSAAPVFSTKKMVGESLSYDIAFLWFDRLAEGRLSLAKAERPDTYRAVLEARTLGIAARLTRDREHEYVSMMEMEKDGRFRSLSHEARTVRGRGDSRQYRARRYVFDHPTGQVLYQRSRNGDVQTNEIMPMAEIAPNDILTAFYNFRAGFFGPLEEGTRHVIPTFSHRGLSDIVVQILTGDERKHFPFFPSDGLLCRVTVDPEIFDTGDGDIYVWFDKEGRPARGIVENVIGLGNVRGTMR
jgi:hypothetical protein